LTGAPLTGIAGVVVLLLLLGTGTPIGVALGLVGFGGLTLLLGLEPALIKSGVIVFDTLSRYELGVLPLFLLMAHLCFAANASRDFFNAAARMVGHRHGGLALASVGACAGFGAISGSSLSPPPPRSGWWRCPRCGSGAIQVRWQLVQWPRAARSDK
jgi:C4-dicarboxylate transporter DctM subunit